MINIIIGYLIDKFYISQYEECCEYCYGRNYCYIRYHINKYNFFDIYVNYKG